MMRPTQKTKNSNTLISSVFDGGRRECSIAWAAFSGRGGDLRDEIGSNPKLQWDAKKHCCSTDKRLSHCLHSANAPLYASRFVLNLKHSQAGAMSREAAGSPAGEDRLARLDRVIAQLQRQTVSMMSPASVSSVHGCVGGAHIPRILWDGASWPRAPTHTRTHTLPLRPPRRQLSAGASPGKPVTGEEDLRGEIQDLRREVQDLRRSVAALQPQPDAGQVADLQAECVRLSGALTAAGREHQVGARVGE